MLRILHISETCSALDGGTATAFVEMIEALRTHAALGSCRVRALTQTLPEDDLARTWIAAHEPGLWTFCGPPGRLRPGALAASARALIDEFRPHVLCVHGLWCTDICAAALHAQARSIPVAWHAHGMLVRDALARARAKKAVFKALWLGRALRRSAAAVFTSDNERDTSNLSLLGQATRREVVPLPVDVGVPQGELGVLRAEGRSRLGLAPDVPLVSFIGRLHPVKRIDISLEAFAAACAGNPNLARARLVLIGAGDDAHSEFLRQHAAKLGVDDRVIFAGWMNGREKHAVLAAADAMIINSSFENFGYCIVESLVLGTPVVCSANLSLARDVAAVDAGCSAVVGEQADPSRAAALGGALRDVLSLSDERRRAMGLAGRTWVERTFSRAAVGRRMLDLYDTLARAI